MTHYRQPLNQMLPGLNNCGLLNQDTLAGLAAQVTNTLTRMTSQGIDGDKALNMIQPTLQTLWQMENDYGYKVDDATQALIDQGVQAGIVGDQHRSAQDRMVAAMEKTATAVEGLAQAFGVQLPDAMSTAADKIKTKLGDVAGKIQTTVNAIPRDIPINISYHSAGAHAEGGVDIPAFATGGVVMGPTLAMVGEGGEPEAIVPLSKARDMGFGGGSGGGSATIVVHLDGREIARATVPHIPDVLHVHGIR